MTRSRSSSPHCARVPTEPMPTRGDPAALERLAQLEAWHAAGARDASDSPRPGGSRQVERIRPQLTRCRPELGADVCREGPAHWRPIRSRSELRPWLPPSLLGAGVFVWESPRPDAVLSADRHRARAPGPPPRRLRAKAADRRVDASGVRALPRCRALGGATACSATAAFWRSSPPPTGSSPRRACPPEPSRSSRSTTFRSTRGTTGTWGCPTRLPSCGSS